MTTGTEGGAGPEGSARRAPKGRGLSALFGDMVVYGAARVLASAIGVILIPIYTRRLETSEYGVLENLNTLSFFVVTIFGLSLPTALTKLYGPAESDGERARVVSSTTFATALLGLLGAALVLPWSGQLGRLFIRNSSTREFALVGLVLTWSWLVLLYNVALTVFRCGFQRRPYLVVSLGVVLLSLVLNVVFVVGFGWGVAGIFAASCISYTLVTAYALWALRERLSLDAISWPMTRRMLSFSAPFAAAALAGYVMRASDRIFIASFVADSLHKVALLAIAEKFMMPLSLFGFAFGMAWAPFALADQGPSTHPTYLRAFRSYVALTALLILCCSLASPLLIRFLTTPAYAPSAGYTAGLGLSFCFDYLYYIGSIGLVISGRSRVLVPIVMCAALLNLGLNFLLIPRFEVQGAIWATNIAGLAYNVATFHFGEKYHFIGFPLGRAMVIYGAAFVAASLGLRWPVVIPFGLTLLVLLIARLGFVSPQDVTDVMRRGRALLSAYAAPANP